MIVRAATPADLKDVLDVESRAFGYGKEAGLVEELLNDPSAAPRLSLLAVRDGACVGHILFTAATVVGPQPPVTAFLLAPMAVVPEAQNQGIGGALVREGLAHLTKQGGDLVFVLGYPAYYRRFGFEPALRHDLAAPYPIPDDHAEAWMVHALRDGLVGALSGRVQCADALYRPEYWRE